MKKVFMFSFVALFFAGCSIFDVSLKSPREDGWTIKKVTLENQEYTLPESAERASMVFDDSNSNIYGRSGCNRYFASFKRVSSGVINISNGGMTRMRCEPSEVMQFERAFTRNFDGDFRVKSDKKILIMENEKLKIILE